MIKVSALATPSANGMMSGCGGASTSVAALATTTLLYRSKIDG